MTARCLELEVSDETPAREPADRQLGQASQEGFYASQQKDWNLDRSSIASLGRTLIRKFKRNF